MLALIILMLAVTIGGVSVLFTNTPSDSKRQSILESEFSQASIVVAAEGGDGRTQLITAGANLADYDQSVSNLRARLASPQLNFTGDFCVYGMMGFRPNCTPGVPSVAAGTESYSGCPMFAPVPCSDRVRLQMSDTNCGPAYFACVMDVDTGDFYILPGVTKRDQFAAVDLGSGCTGCAAPPPPASKPIATDPVIIPSEPGGGDPGHGPRVIIPGHGSL